jgi:hypothetical protein
MKAGREKATRYPVKRSAASPISPLLIFQKCLIFPLWGGHGVTCDRSKVTKAAVTSTSVARKSSCSSNFHVLRHGTFENEEQLRCSANYVVLSSTSDRGDPSSKCSSRPNGSTYSQRVQSMFELMRTGSRAPMLARW